MVDCFVSSMMPLLSHHSILASIVTYALVLTWPCLMEEEPEAGHKEEETLSMTMLICTSTRSLATTIVDMSKTPLPRHHDRFCRIHGVDQGWGPEETLQ